MVNVGTQAVSNTGLNPRDLAPLTNDAFLATFTGKTSLAASNGISRQHNNYRQSYTTQMERVTIRSKARPLSSNGESGEPDSAILSIIRGNGSDNHQQVTNAFTIIKKFSFSSSHHLIDNYMVIVVVVHSINNNFSVVGMIYLVRRIIDQQMIRLVDVVHVLVVHHNNKSLLLIKWLPNLIFHMPFCPNVSNLNKSLAMVCNNNHVHRTIISMEIIVVLVVQLLLDVHNDHKIIMIIDG